MLTNLHVRNLALIEETEINFQEGLNILTGETGAGKSIILGSINLALGSKVSADIIRKGADYALTELSFHLEERDRIEALQDLGIEELEDGEVIISRKITPTRSQFKVNGQSFTAAQVRQIASYLIDIHGQHDNQQLLNENRHLDIVDAYGASVIHPVKERLKEAFQAYSDTKSKLQSMDTDEEGRNREISFIEFEVNEITNAQLLPNEDAELESSYKKMVNSQKIMEEMAQVDQAIVSGEENAGAMVSNAIRFIHMAASYDDNLKAVADALDQIESMLGDVSIQITDYMEDSTFDEEDFSGVQERLDVINSLKMKYGKTIEDIQAYCEDRQNKLDQLNHYEEEITRLEKLLSEQEAVVDKICNELTLVRKKAANGLTKSIIAALKELNFLDVRFDTEFAKTSYSSNGNDSIRFIISTNPGEDLKPLSKIASGGELSRIMLAIKTVIANQDHIGTLIFDEIDAGISGRTAQLVANKLSQLSRSHQIICITHLPQIASMADLHFMIEKNVTGNKTTTRIFELNEDESVSELARLLGGSSITEAAMNNAIEMKRVAINVKKS